MFKGNVKIQSLVISRESGVNTELGNTQYPISNTRLR